FVGRDSLDSVQTGVQSSRIPLWPAADHTTAVAANVRNGIAKMAPVQDHIMSDVPYGVYTIFFSVIHEPVRFGGGLEHSYSQYDIMPAQAFADPSGKLGDVICPLLSHEFLDPRHVKRLRASS